MDNVEWRRQVDAQLRDLNKKVKPSRRKKGGGGGSGVSNGGWVEAESYDLLTDPNTLTKRTIQARVTAGDQRDQIYKQRWNEEDEVFFWECVSETYDRASAAELPNGPYVQKFALGRVGSIYYRRNDDNSGWEAQNQWT